MIMVDIYMPALDQSYDFMLDENAVLSNIVLEVSEMIAKTTKSRLTDENNGFVLYHPEKGAPLSESRTLYESGVRDGDRLILV
jgi:hypothetical protein